MKIGRLSAANTGKVSHEDRCHRWNRAHRLQTRQYTPWPWPRCVGCIACPDTGVNTITGKGVAAALAGAQVVVDVANSPSFEDKAVVDFFETSGRNLLAAEAAAGVRHHVALSVVGTERLQGSGYFRGQDGAGGV